MQIDTKELNSLKLDLVSRKINKSFQESKILDDSDITYLDDCLNIVLDNFELKDLILIIKTDILPSNYIVKPKDIKEITLNGITDLDSNYIIVEPLENQINIINKLGITDTRLKANIKLNPKTIILVKEDKKIDNDIKDCKVIRYKGDIKTILAKLLILYNYKPQELENKNFKRKENVKILINYLRTNYPDKLPIDTKERLRERQNKEINVRDEVLSIIRKSPLLIIDDIDITSNELVILAEYYKNIHGLQDEDLDELEFIDFVNIYGIRLNNNGIYLLDSDALINSEYVDNNTIKKIYNIYLRAKRNYKERLGIISNRKKILKSIDVEDIKEKRNITIEELGKLYKTYQKDNANDNSVQRFMKNVGVRINESEEIYLLNNEETISLMEFIESRDEDKIAIYLRDKLNLDCYTEDEKEFGTRLKSMNTVNLSFDGLEDLFSK